MVSINPVYILAFMQLLTLMVMVGGGVAAFVTIREGLKNLKKQFEKHVVSNEKDFEAIDLISTANQAAQAGLRQELHETRFEVRSLLTWRDRIEQRGGPQPPMTV